MSSLTNSRALSAPPNPYPFLSGAAEMGLTITLRGHSQIGFAPPELVTPAMLEIARANYAAILSELQRSAAGAAADRAADTCAVTRQHSRWDTTPNAPPHDLDALELALRGLFRACEDAGFAAAQYWDGPPEKPPQTRPYCYVRAVLVDSKWLYWPILAGSDGLDCFWLNAARWVEELDGELTAEQDGNANGRSTRQWQPA